MPRPRGASLRSAMALLFALLGAACLAAGAAPAEAQGWTLERMQAEYGSGEDSFAPSWPLLQTRKSAGAGAGALPREDSWLGGYSQYYGAGGVSPIDAAGGVLAPRFNAMVPGFGASGSRSLRPRASAALEDAARRARNDLLNQVETTLWAANIFRDNIITVFGYILNLPGNHLSAELYSSLYRIYEEVIFRRVHTVPLVRKLNDMCRVSPTRQMKSLFRSLQAVARPYLRSSVEFWLEALEKGEVDLDGIIRPNDGPLVVDFLEGIDPSVVKQLAHAPEFPAETQQRADAEDARLMGGAVAQALAALADGALPLTQTLFALLLLSRPLQAAVPQRLEAERYISDSLRLRVVRDWSAIVGQAEKVRARGSYEFTRAVLSALAASHSVEASLRGAARLVHTYIEPPRATYSNPNFNYTAAIMSLPTIDVLLILKAITPSEYPEDVVDAKNRLKFYIENGYLDMEFVVKGFNRFDHVQPINLVIAILARIEMRLPNLPHEVKSSVKYLKVYLIFKKFLCSLSPHIPQDFLEAPFLLDAFEGPLMPRKIHKLVAKLEESLRTQRLPVEKLIAETPVEECSRPRQCILNVYSRVVRKGYIKGKAKQLMEKLITSLDINGNPLTPPGTPEFEVKSVRKNKCHKNRNRQWNKLVVKRLTTTPRSYISSTKYSSETVVSVNVTSTHLQEDEHITENSYEYIYSGAPEPPIQFPIHNNTEIYSKPDYSNPENLLPPTEIGTIQDTKIRPIREFLKLPDVYSMLGYSFRPQAYATKLLLTIAILKRAVALSMVKFDMILSKTIQEYLAVLENLPRRPQIVNQFIFPNISEDYELQVANYEEPYKNLPECLAGSPECGKIYPIRLFLSDENLYYKLGPYFNPSQFRTKGEFIKGLLVHAIRLKRVQQNSLLYRAIKQFLSYINEAHVQPLEVENTPFPDRDPVRDYEPPNWRHPLTLLPQTFPGTAEYIKMRPIREFFARPDFWKIIGPDFQPQVYRTKGQLITALVNHSLPLQWVKEKAQLFTALQKYQLFLQSFTQTPEGGASDVGINILSLVKALPYPENPQEEAYLRLVRELFQQPQFFALMTPLVAQAQVRTRGAALQMLLQLALEKQDAYQPDPVTVEALQYFKDRVIQEGYGAQSVDYFVLKKKMDTIMLSVLDLFRAIDHNRLTDRDRLRVKRVIYFVSYNFDPNKYLNGFQFQMYTTKGSFLKAAFAHMLKLDYLNPRIRSDMQFLTTYVMENGPGAEVLHVGAPHQE